MFINRLQVGVTGGTDGPSEIRGEVQYEVDSLLFLFDVTFSLLDD